MRNESKKTHLEGISETQVLKLCNSCHVQLKKKELEALKWLGEPVAIAQKVLLQKNQVDRIFIMTGKNFFEQSSNAPNDTSEVLLEESHSPTKTIEDRNESFCM